MSTAPAPAPARTRVTPMQEEALSAAARHPEGTLPPMTGVRTAESLRRRGLAVAGPSYTDTITDAGRAAVGAAVPAPVEDEAPVEQDGPVAAAETPAAASTRPRSAERTTFLADVLCAALEGGIGYWSEAADIVRVDEATGYVGWRYDAVTLFETDGDDDTCSQGDGACAGHRVTLDEVASALGRFTRGKRDEAAAVLKVHSSYVRTIREADAENDGGEIDADLADMIVQVAALGSVIYG